MRILMIADFYHPYVGGVEQHVRTLSHGLARRGHSVLVSTLDHPERPEYELDGQVRVARMRGLAQRSARLHEHAHRRWAPPMPDPSITRALNGLVRRFKPDVVHGHEWLARSYLPLKPLHPARLVMSLHYYTLSCAKKTLMQAGEPCSGPAPGKCFACAREHFGDAKGPLVLALHRSGSIAERRLVDHYIAVSNATAEGNRVAGRDNLTVIPNFLPHRADRTEVSGELVSRLPDEPYFLFVGDFRRDKGLDVLLEAYAQVAEPPPLVLIGKTWTEAAPSVPTGVVNLGEWPSAAVQVAWERCLAGVVPSVWAEPFGLVVIEALRAGKPVIASRSGGIPEIIEDGHTGLLVRPDAPADLAEALARVAQDGVLREQLGRNARVAAGAYREEIGVTRTESVYRGLIAGRNAA